MLWQTGSCPPVKLPAFNSLLLLLTPYLPDFSSPYFWQVHDLPLSLRPSERKGYGEREKVHHILASYGQHHHAGCARLSPSSPCRRTHLHEERRGAQLLPHAPSPSPRRTSQLLSRQRLYRQPLRSAYPTHRASGSRAEACPAACRTQHIPQATVRLWRTLPTCFILTLHRVAAR